MVIPVAIKCKKENWCRSPETLPYIQNDSNIIKAKNFLHVLRGDDLMLFIRHKTKNKAIAWANENEDNVFNV